MLEPLITESLTEHLCGLARRMCRAYWLKRRTYSHALCKTLQATSVNYAQTSSVSSGETNATPISESKTPTLGDQIGVILRLPNRPPQSHVGVCEVLTDFVDHAIKELGLDSSLCDFNLFNIDCTGNTDVNSLVTDGDVITIQPKLLGGMAGKHKNKKGKKQKGERKQVEIVVQQPRQRPMAQAAAPGGRNLMIEAGGALGGLFGPVGAAIGRVGGFLTSRLFGSGDYKVSSNTFVSGKVPAFGGDELRITRTSYLQDISTTTSFSMTKFSINPIIDPFLASLSQVFEEWEPKGLVFFFKPTSGDALNSTNAALGSINMATIYDPDMADFTSLNQLLNYDYTSSGNPSQPIAHPVECAANKTAFNKLFTRGFTQVGDTRLTDLGNFYVATSGSQASYVAGQLWVAWDVVFRKRRVNMSQIAFSHFMCPAFSGSNGVTNATTFNLPANLRQNGAGITIPTTMPSTSSRKVYLVFPLLPVGTLFYVMSITGWATSAGTTVSSAAVNYCTTIASSTTSDLFPSALSTGTLASFNCLSGSSAYQVDGFSVTDAQHAPVVSVDPGTGTGAGNWDIHVLIFLPSTTSTAL